MKTKNTAAGFLLVGMLGLSVVLAAAPVAQKAASLPKTGALKLKAGVAMKSGDVKMIAAHDFFISTVPFSVYKKELFDSEKVIGQLPGQCALFMMDKVTAAFTRIGYSGNIGDERVANLAAFKNFLEASSLPISEVCTTGLNGECAIGKLIPGQYFIVSGPISLGFDRFGWDYPIEIKPGEALSLELNNKNMADLSPVEDYIESHCGYQMR